MESLSPFYSSDRFYTLLTVDLKSRSDVFMLQSGVVFHMIDIPWNRKLNLGSVHAAVNQTSLQQLVVREDHRTQC